MKCSICEKHLNDYLEGNLSSDLSGKIQDHLEHCEMCLELYAALRSVDQLILEEKKLNPSPFLTSKVMNLIRPNEMSNANGTKFQRILQPLLIAASVTLAVLGGIKAGNIYSSTKTEVQIPAELALMDDLSLESFNMITQE